jgi:hypothetical protein
MGGSSRRVVKKVFGPTPYNDTANSERSPIPADYSKRYRRITMSHWENEKTPSESPSFG